MKQRYEPQVPIDQLTPHPNNPRQHDDDTILESLEAHGFYGAVIAQESTGTIIAGHGRHRNARNKGHSVVPVLYLDVDDDEAVRIMLADNRTGDAATYDDAMLADILGDIDDLTGTGWDDDDLAGILETLDPPAVPIEDPDAVPDTAPAITEPGDVWQLGPHRLICGDSTDAKNYPPAESVHLVCTDPPYFRKVDEDWDDQWAGGFDGFLQFLADVFAVWAPLIDQRAAVAVFTSPDFVWETELKLREHFQPFNHIVWFKGHGMGATVSVDDMRRFRPRSERLLLAEKKHGPSDLLSAFTAKTSHIAASEAYKDIRELLCDLRDRAGVTNKQVDDALGTSGMAGHYFGASQWVLPHEEAWATIAPLFAAGGVEPPAYAELLDMFTARRREFDAARREFDAARREFDADISEQRTDVWELQAPRGDDRWGDHAAAKPVALIAKIIDSSSRDGDLVLDPFGGSGTTLIAAETLGRKCWMIELDPTYCDVICKRYETATGDTPTRNGEPVTFLDVV